MLPGQCHGERFNENTCNNYEPNFECLYIPLRLRYCALVADLFSLTGAVALGVHLNLESPEPNGTYWHPVTAASKRDNIYYSGTPL